MKTKLAVLLALCMLLLAVTGCSQSEATPTTTATVAPTEAATEAVVLPTDMTGKLVSFIGSKLTITNEQDANDYTFDVSEAEISAKNMVAGDEILVLFSGEFNGTDTSAVTVLKVEDLGGAPTEQEQHEVAGTLVYIGENTITIQLNDGAQLVFNSNNCEHHFKNGIQEGNWVSVTYVGELNGTDTSSVKVLVITDDDENAVIQEAQDTMSIEDRDEIVYCNYPKGVHIRASYTTKSDIVGSLGFAEAIRRTGVCANGWSRVAFNDEVAYIYGEYLSTTVPEEPEEEVTISPKDDTMYCNHATGVNVRASYTTHSDVIGSLVFGQAVRRTGECSNGWYRIVYKNQDAYVYGIYLSKGIPATDPQPAPHHDPAPSASKQHTVSASVVECSMNTISIAPDGYTEIFTLDVSDAEHRYANGIQTGNRVTVTYTGDLNDIGSVRVLLVVDNEANATAAAVYTGTVVGGTMNTITIQTDDGAQVIFDKQDATINLSGIVEGIRVRITADPTMSEPSSNILFAAVIDPA